MLELTTHTFLFLSRKEVWFYNGEKIKPELYTTFSASKVLPEFNSRYLEKYSTSVVDLSADEASLFNAIHPSFRYDIRSAEKLNLRAESNFTVKKEDCINLINDYNLFAAERGLAKMNYKFVLTLQKKGNLSVTQITLHGVVVITHTYIHDSETISLTSSFHNVEVKDDKLRSAANKLLHWKDLLAFKKKGFRFYDFGGLNHLKLPGISKFKESFGGQTTDNYRLIIAPPFVFGLIRFIKSRKGKWKKI